MNTKSIPAVVMLSAGLITCIAGIAEHMEVIRFTKMLFFVLIVFYLFGCIVKLILDKGFAAMRKKEETTDGDNASEEEDEEIEAEEQEEE